MASSVLGYARFTPLKSVELERAPELVCKKYTPQSLYVGLL